MLQQEGRAGAGGAFAMTFPATVPYPFLFRAHIPREADQLQRSASKLFPELQAPPTPGTPANWHAQDAPAGTCSTHCRRWHTLARTGVDL